MPDSWCVHCGAVLAPEAERCPQCGAATGVKPKPRSRAPAAAVLLVALAAFGLFNGSFNLINPLNPLLGPPSETLGTFEVTGTVYHADGTPAAGVQVNTSREVAKNITTDATGYYRIQNLTAGFIELTFVPPGGPPQTVRAFLLRSQQIDGNLPPPDGAPVRVDHKSLSSIVTIVRVLGFFLVAIGLYALAGAYLCFKRRAWGWTMGAAILSMITFFPISIILGVVAIVLVARMRREFRPGTA